MIVVKNKKNCCGCSACASVCPKKCIVMTCDNEGFLYPKVDELVCIDCHLCEKVCHFLRPSEKTPLRKGVFAAVSESNDIRMMSSSGGVFHELAYNFIRHGGCVFGAAFTNDWSVRHIMVEEAADLWKLRRSKYVQSELGNTYNMVLTQLRKGRMVLFSGTSCQIAGLRRFLKNDFPQLLTVEILCHGVPSNKVWQMYLNGFLNDKGCKKDDLCAFSFRTKVEDVTEYKLSFDMNDQRRFSHFFYEDPYMKAFLSNLTLRPSCYSCKAKGESESDIALGDLWNKYPYAPFNDSKGTNVVIVNTDKGHQWLQQCKLIIADIGKEGIDYYKNSGFQRYQFLNPYRKKFFQEVNSKNIIKLLNKYSEIPVCWRMIRRLKRLLKI